MKEHIVIFTIDVISTRPLKELKAEAKRALESAGIAVRQIGAQVIQPISAED